MSIPVLNLGMIGHVDHGKCISPDDFILLNNNVVTGRDLIDMVNKRGDMVKKTEEGAFYDVGVSCYCLDDNLELVKSRALVYLQPYEGDMLNVGTSSGRELTATPNHPFLVNREGELNWIQGKDLKAGDYIAIVKKLELDGKNWNEEYANELERDYIIVDEKKMEELREKTKDFANFSECDDEEINEIRVLNKLSNRELADAVGAERKYVTESFNRRGLSEPLREKITSLFDNMPEPSLSEGEIVTCSRKDGGNILSFRDAEISRDIVKWMAFLSAKGTIYPNRIRVTQKTYLNLLREFFEISSEEFGINFRKISDIDYEFNGKAFVRYLSEKFHILPGGSRDSSMPSWILSVSKELQRTFLRWFITLECELNEDSIVVTQANKKNIQILTLLLLNNDVYAKLSKRSGSATNGRCAEREYHQLRISGKVSLKRFLEKIGFEDSSKEAKILDYLSRVKGKSKDTNLVVPIDYSKLKEILLSLGMNIDKVGEKNKKGRKKLASNRRWYYSLRNCRVKNAMSESMFKAMLRDIEKRILYLKNLLEKNDFERLKREFKITVNDLMERFGLGRTAIYRWRRQKPEAMLSGLKKICQERIKFVEKELEKLTLISSELISYDKVKKIVKVPSDGYVVDLAVPGFQNFISGYGGLVSHNTTLTEALSGSWTDRHSEELKRGVSIRLGYANAVFRKCEECDIYTVEEKCPKCGGDTRALRRISFVDSPGHETLMATMLSGAALMDGAVLVIAADEPCPQPQTKEHLTGLEIIGVENIVVVQNKIELVSREEVERNYEQIKSFLEKTEFEDAPIIPISAAHKVNIDKLIEAIEKTIPTKERELSKPPRMYVARSFDVNRPGTPPEDLTGGVIGGSLLQGKWKVDEEVEICPGIRVEEGGKTYWKSLRSKIISLRADGELVKEVTPGGLIGVGTSLDPSYTKADSMADTVAGKPGTLPPLLDEATIKVNLLDYIVGLRGEKEVKNVSTNEPLMLIVGTTATVGTVTSARGSEVDIDLRLPVCAEKGARVAINRQVKNRWRLIGYGIIS